MFRLFILLTAVFTLITYDRQGFCSELDDAIKRAQGKGIKSSVTVSAGDLRIIEKETSIRFTPELEKLILALSTYSLPTYEIAHPKGGKESFLYEIIIDARQQGLPTNYIPFCEDNGNCFCLDIGTGEVRYWWEDDAILSDVETDKWSSLASWICKEWVKSN